MRPSTQGARGLAMADSVSRQAHVIAKVNVPEPGSRATTRVWTLDYHVRERTSTMLETRGTQSDDSEASHNQRAVRTMNAAG